MVLSFLFHLYLMLIIITTYIHLDEAIEASNKRYKACKKQQLCHNINITYPFYDDINRPAYCGHPGFKLNCSSNQPEILMPSSEIYYLISMNPSLHTLKVVRKDFWDGFCPRNLSAGSINRDLFKFTSENGNITLYYGCLDPSDPTALNAEVSFPCPGLFGESGPENGYYMPMAFKAKYGVGLCKTNISVTVDKLVVSSIADIKSLQAALSSGFELEWYANNDSCDNCRHSGGECGWNPITDKFTCYCPDAPSNSTCTYGSNKNTHKIVGPILVIVASTAIGAGIFLIVPRYFRRKSSSDNQDDDCIVLHANQDIEAFLKAHQSLPPKRYNYADLKKITKSFREILGEGAYGTVYKGKLNNGHLVAVKLLKKSKGNAEEFINEVASIGRTNHVNVVTLLGFCFQGHKKALVYDYMPNGSLEKYIYRRNNHQTLAWGKLFQIAVGVARGLEYLHQGCNTRILHFDIKPHNILLDENFCPKISDFGLAKSCAQKDSNISLSVARGTVGFIAPEVFLRGFGGVSYKSDVYSYGMLVLEMIGRRKEANLEAENSSEEYFPQWIYKELTQGEKVDHQGTVNEEDKVLQKKMILVSLWCIQTKPSNRPTMTRVVEMLEGALESLQLPPMPSLSSPLMSMPNSLIVDTISL